MKNKFEFKNLIKKLFIVIIFTYVIYIFFCQQQSLNSYATSQEYYQGQISKEQEYKDSLVDLKKNINSEEYIERTAREKLDMYLPNERVYIDIEK